MWLLALVLVLQLCDAAPVSVDAAPGTSSATSVVATPTVDEDAGQIRALRRNENKGGADDATVAGEADPRRLLQNPERERRRAERLRARAGTAKLAASAVVVLACGPVWPALHPRIHEHILLLGKACSVTTHFTRGVVCRF